jgi:hypothetical protein
VQPFFLGGVKVPPILESKTVFLGIKVCASHDYLLIAKAIVKHHADFSVAV